MVRIDGPAEGQGQQAKNRHEAGSHRRPRCECLPECIRDSGEKPVTATDGCLLVRASFTIGRLTTWIKNMAFPAPYTAAPSRYDSMPYRRCGRSGLKLPAISL